MPPTPMSDPHYKALLIGNGKFERDPHNLLPLKGPANDLRLLASALTHGEFGLFSPGNVRQLLDADDREIVDAVETFFSEAGPKDHLLFYYSGHGIRALNNEFYLCARNTMTTKIVSTGVSDRRINSIAESAHAQKYFFILDCCHSGGFKGGTASLELAHGTGRCLITACASTELSRDALDGSGASAFTQTLAEALVCGEVDTDGDGVVLTSEVFKYVQPRVYNATKQSVQWSMDKTFGEAAIARAVPRRKPGEASAPPMPIKTESGRPILEVSSQQPIDCRQVQLGEKLPIERIDIFNSGEGVLDWVFECEESWITVERKGDTLLVKLDTNQPGFRRGNIYVRDRGRGGARTIRVLLEVIEPVVPRLIVSPASLDFGRRIVGEPAKLELRVSNGGAGRLNWEIESSPASVVSIRNEHGVTVELAPNFCGALKEVLRLKSNGGSVEVPLVGNVEPRQPPVLPEPPRIDPLVQALQGWWMNDAGAICIRLEGNTLTYTDHNLMSIKVGQGTLQVQNGVALVQGMNTFSGAYTGQFTVQGNMLTGSLMMMGQVMPVMFMRQQPWFAAFAN